MNTILPRAEAVASKNQHAGAFPPVIGSVMLAEGRYENGKGAWLEVLDVQMPGYPKYDGGMTGVSIKWGRHRQFVVARDEAHFWSQWPYSLCAPSQNANDEPRR